MATVTKLMTHAEFLALPEDETVRRELINGELVEEPYMPSGFRHGRIVTIVARKLDEWRERTAFPGAVSSGDVGCHLHDEADTTVGIDAVVVGRDSDSGGAYLEGPPLLAVEVISPSDLHGKLVARQELYLRAGVQQSWLVDPTHRTVTKRQQGERFQILREEDELIGDPTLPGFRVVVGELFPPE